MLGGDVETGGLELAVVVIATLTAWNSRSRAKAAVRGVSGVQPWEALLAFALFVLFGGLSVLDATRDEGARATTDVVGAVLLFALAGAAFWVLWRARTRA